MTWKIRKGLSKVAGVNRLKTPLMVKSVFSLELKYSKWLNSRTYPRLVRLSPFYREFGVGLLVRYY